MQDKQNQVILGIDPGTRITGYGVILIDSGIKVLDYGCIKPPALLPLEKRYLIIFEAIEQIIKKFSPSALSVESQFVMKNAQSAIKLGMAKGMAFLAAAKNDIPIFEYTPKKAKMAAVGNGNACKLQVQKMLQIMLNLPSPPMPEDASDALALALCHANSNFLNNLKEKICLNT
jgi:crossover junction endodeoxyribonuclease RuvC